jgi:hypothetical protein
MKPTDRQILVDTYREAQARDENSLIVNKEVVYKRTGEGSKKRLLGFK